jgi:signal transduction histidine kinase
VNQPLPPPQPRRVKAAFIAPLAMALILIMGIFTATILGVASWIRDQDLAERSAAVDKLVRQKLDKDTNLMLATMRALMTNREVESALRQGDRQALARLGTSLFTTLRDEHRFSHLYFTGPDLINLYRFHSPAEHGDRIDRSTMTQARDRQAPVHGLELGTMGTLTLRLVMPWRDQTGLLGYVEVGEEIEHLIDEVRSSLSVDLLVLVDKHYLQQDQWLRGQQLMKRSGDWQRFASHAALAQTTDALPAALDDATLRQLQAGRTVEIRDQGRSLHLALVRLDDAGGRHIGDLVVMRDISRLESAFLWSIVAVMLLGLLVAAGVLGTFYLALDRVERDYRRQHDLEHQLLRLNTEHQRIVQLEKLSALGTMVGSIAHQLNNPLVGVVNLAQLAEREAGDPSRTRELLTEIRSAGEDCRALVRRMLAFSKVSCFESKPTPMASLIEDAVLMFRQTEDRQLPVEVQLPEEPAVLTVDPILIRHALFNLLVNAAQATPGDGAVVITLEQAPASADRTAGWTLSVRDHGRGIAPEVMDKIFDPFFTTRSDGTGLGLPVVQHVALLHGGHVTAENVPGHGTRFAIWIPQTEPAH